MSERKSGMPSSTHLTNKQKQMPRTFPQASGTSPINMQQTQQPQMYSQQVPLGKQVPTFIPGQHPHMFTAQMPGPYNNAANMQFQRHPMNAEVGPNLGNIPPVAGPPPPVPVPSHHAGHPGALSQISASEQLSTVNSPFATPIPTPTGAIPLPASVLGPAAVGAPVPPGVAPNSSTTGPQRRFVPNTVASYPIRKYLSNMAILRLHEIINLLNVSTGSIDSYGYWHRFVTDFFAPYGVSRYSRKNGDETRQFEFTMPIIPTILHSLAAVGVFRLEFVPQQLRAQVLSNGTIFFECPRCTITSHYSDGSYMTNFSQIKGIFDSMLKVEWIDVCIHSFVPGIEWNSLERLIGDERVCHEVFNSLKPPNSLDDSKQNPSGTSNLPRDGTVPANFSTITKLRSQFKVFQSISSFGVHEGFMRVLQVNDVMSYLKNLKVYQKVNGIKSPLETLEAFVASNSERRDSTAAPPIKTSTAPTPSNIPSAAPTSDAPTRPPSTSEKRPLAKRRRQSDLSPFSSAEKNTPTPSDLLDTDASASFKKIKF